MDAFFNHLQHSAFQTLSVAGHTVDLTGWIRPEFDDTFRNAISAHSRDKPLVIVEVGSWKGLSATRMASIVKELGFHSAKIVCVDTWLGAPEFWTWGRDDPTRGGSLGLVNGFPSVFYTFTKNVKSVGHDDVIVPFPISSVQGADVLKNLGVKADVIYVDGAHEFDAVSSDLQKYWPLLKTGGTLIGDDFDPMDWKGVVLAAQVFALSVQCPLTTRGAVWTLVKP